MTQIKVGILVHSALTLALGLFMQAIAFNIKDIDPIYVPLDLISLKKGFSSNLVSSSTSFILVSFLLFIIATNKEYNLFWKFCIVISTLFALFIYFSSFGFSTIFLQIIDDNLSVSSCKTGYLKEANETFNQLKEIWCRSKPKHINEQDVDIGCGCYIPDYSNWSEEDQALLKNTNVYQNIQSVEPIGKRTVQECDYFAQVAQDKLETIKFLQFIENHFQCTGICEGDVIYYFNDVSVSHPSSSQGCFGLIAEKSKYYLISLQNVQNIVYLYASLTLFLISFDYFEGKKRKLE